MVRHARRDLCDVCPLPNVTARPRHDELVHAAHAQAGDPLDREASQANVFGGGAVEVGADEADHQRHPPDARESTNPSDSALAD